MKRARTEPEGAGCAVALPPCSISVLDGHCELTVRLPAALVEQSAVLTNLCRETPGTAQVPYKADAVLSWVLWDMAESSGTPCDVQAAAFEAAVFLQCQRATDKLSAQLGKRLVPAFGSGSGKRALKAPPDAPWLTALPHDAMQHVLGAMPRMSLARQLSLLPPSVRAAALRQHIVPHRPALIVADIPDALPDATDAALTCALQCAPALATVTRLTLANLPTLSEHSLRLLSAAPLPALRALELCSVLRGIVSVPGWRTVEALAQALSRHSQLTALTVASCKLDDQSGVDLAPALAQLRGLCALDVSDNCLGHRTAAQLSRALRGCPALTRLDLSHNELAIAGYCHLALSGLPRGLRALCIEGVFGTDPESVSWSAPAARPPHDVSAVDLIAQSLAGLTGLQELRCGTHQQCLVPAAQHAKAVRGNEGWALVASAAPRLRELEGGGRAGQHGVRACRELTRLRWAWHPQRAWPQAWAADEAAALSRLTTLCELDVSVDWEDHVFTGIEVSTGHIVRAVAALTTLTRLRLALAVEVGELRGSASAMLAPLTSCAALRHISVLLRDDGSGPIQHEDATLLAAWPSLETLSLCMCSYLSDVEGEPTRPSIELDCNALLRAAPPTLRELVLAAHARPHERVDAALACTALTALRVAARYNARPAAPTVVDAVAAQLMALVLLRTLELDYMLSPLGTIEALEALPHLQALETLLLVSNVPQFVPLLTAALGPHTALCALCVQTDTWQDVRTAAEASEIVKGLTQLQGLERLEMVQVGARRATLPRVAIQELVARLPRLTQLCAAPEGVAAETRAGVLQTSHRAERGGPQCDIRFSHASHI